MDFQGSWETCRRIRNFERLSASVYRLSNADFSGNEFHPGFISNFISNSSRICLDRSCKEHSNALEFRVEIGCPINLSLATNPRKPSPRGRGAKGQKKRSERGQERSNKGPKALLAKIKKKRLSASFISSGMHSLSNKCGSLDFPVVSLSLPCRFPAVSLSFQQKKVFVSMGIFAFIAVLNVIFSHCKTNAQCQFISQAVIIGSII